MQMYVTPWKRQTDCLCKHRKRLAKNFAAIMQNLAINSWKYFRVLCVKNWFHSSLYRGDYTVFVCIFECENLVWYKKGLMGQKNVWNHSLELTESFTFSVSFIFNWVGFIFAYCVTNTIAGRYGALSGFGLSLIKWVFIIKVNLRIIQWKTCIYRPLDLEVLPFSSMLFKTSSYCYIFHYPTFFREVHITGYTSTKIPWYLPNKLLIKKLLSFPQWDIFISNCFVLTNPGAVPKWFNELISLPSGTFSQSTAWSHIL